MTKTQPKPGTNGFDPEKTKVFVSRIESINEQIASVKASNAKRCQDLQADIGEVLDEAKAAGIPKKELKANLKRRDLERKLEAIREDLEPEEQDNYDLIRHALGDLADLPLGQAALGEQTDIEEAIEETKMKRGIGDQPATHSLAQ